MSHEVKRRWHIAIAAVTCAHSSAWAHGQDAIIPGVALLLECIGAVAMLVVVFVRETRAHRAAHGFVQAGKFLGLFFGSAVVVGALYDTAYPPQGLYSPSLPIGFAFGLVIAFVWYIKRGKKERQHAT